MTHDFGEESSQSVGEVGELRRRWRRCSVFATFGDAECAGACWCRSLRRGAARLHNTWACHRRTPQALASHESMAESPRRTGTARAPEGFEAGLGAPPVEGPADSLGRTRWPDPHCDPSCAGGRDPATQAVLRGGGSRGRFLCTGHGVHSPGFEGRRLLAEPPFPFVSPCTIPCKGENRGRGVPNSPSRVCSRSWLTALTGGEVDSLAAFLTGREES